MDFTKNEMVTIRNSITARLDNILNDDDLKDVVSPFEIARMMVIFEKLGYEYWAKKYREDFDYINFDKIHLKD